MLIPRAQEPHTFAETLNQLYNDERFNSQSALYNNPPQPWFSELEAELADGDCVSILSQSSSLGQSTGWMTELQKAISACDIQLVEYLLRTGASEIGRVDSNGNSPIHICMLSYSAQNSMKMTEIAIMLLRHGAPANAQNYEGWTPIQLAGIRGSFSALKFTVAYNLMALKEFESTDNIRFQISDEQREEIYKQIIFDYKLQGGPNKQGLAHIAASIGQATMLEFLFRMNLNMLEVNGNGQTPRQVAIHSLVIHKLLHKYEKLWLKQALFSDCECVDEEVETLKYSSVEYQIYQQILQISNLMNKFQYDKMLEGGEQNKPNTIFQKYFNNKKKSFLEQQQQERQKYSRELSNQNTPKSFQLLNQQAKEGGSIIGTEFIQEVNGKLNEITSKGVPYESLPKQKGSFLNSSGFTSLFDGDGNDCKRSGDFLQGVNYKDNKNLPPTASQNSCSIINDSCSLSQSFLNNLNKNSQGLQKDVPNKSITPGYHAKIQPTQSFKLGNFDNGCEPEDTEGHCKNETEVSELEVEECINEAQLKNQLNHCASFISTNNFSSSTRMIDHSRKKGDWNTFEMRMKLISAKEEVSVQQFKILIDTIKLQLINLVQGSCPPLYCDKTQSFISNSNSNTSNQFLSRSPSFCFQNNLDIKNLNKIEEFRKYINYLLLLQIKLMETDKVKFNEDYLPPSLRILSHHVKFNEENNNPAQIKFRESLVSDAFLEVFDLLTKEASDQVQKQFCLNSNKKIFSTNKIEQQLSRPQQLKSKIMNEEYQSQQQEGDNQEGESSFLADSIFHLIRALQSSQAAHNSNQIKHLAKQSVKLQPMKKSQKYLEYFDQQTPLIVKKKTNKQILMEEEFKIQFQKKKVSKETIAAAQAARRKLMITQETEIICHRENHNNPKILLDFECFQEITNQNTIFASKQDQYSFISFKNNKSNQVSRNATPTRELMNFSQNDQSRLPLNIGKMIYQQDQNGNISNPGTQRQITPTKQSKLQFIVQPSIPANQSCYQSSNSSPYHPQQRFTTPIRGTVISTISNDHRSINTSPISNFPSQYINTDRYDSNSDINFHSLNSNTNYSNNQSQAHQYNQSTPVSRNNSQSNIFPISRNNSQSNINSNQSIFPISRNNSQSNINQNQALIPQENNQTANTQAYYSQQQLIQRNNSFISKKGETTLWQGYGTRQDQSPVMRYTRSAISPGRQGVSPLGRQGVSPVNRVAVSPATKASFLPQENQNNQQQSCLQRAREALNKKINEKCENIPFKSSNLSNKHEGNGSQIQSNPMNQQVDISNSYKRYLQDQEKAINFIRKDIIIDEKKSNEQIDCNMMNFKSLNSNNYLNSNKSPCENITNYQIIYNTNNNNHNNAGISNNFNNQIGNQKHNLFKKEEEINSIKNNNYSNNKKQVSQLLQEQNQLFSSLKQDESNLKNGNYQIKLNASNNQQNNLKQTKLPQYQQQITNQIPSNNSYQRQQNQQQSSEPAQLTRLEMANLQGHVNFRRNRDQLINKDGEENIVDDEGDFIDNSSRSDYHDTASNYRSPKQLLSPFQLKNIIKF